MGKYEMGFFVIVVLISSVIFGAAAGAQLQVFLLREGPGTFYEFNTNDGIAQFLSLLKTGPSYW